MLEDTESRLAQNEADFQSLRFDVQRNALSVKTIEADTLRAFAVVHLRFTVGLILVSCSLVALAAGADATATVTATTTSTCMCFSLLILVMIICIFLTLQF